jgi:hypothetical protein
MRASDSPTEAEAPARPTPGKILVNSGMRFEAGASAKLVYSEVITSHAIRPTKGEGSCTRHRPE